MKSYIKDNVHVIEYNHEVTFRRPVRRDADSAPVYAPYFDVYKSGSDTPIHRLYIIGDPVASSRIASQYVDRRYPIAAEIIFGTLKENLQRRRYERQSDLFEEVQVDFDHRRAFDLSKFEEQK